MGVYSTVTITRAQCIDSIMQLLETASNEELSNALFALTENNTLDNYNVVNNESELPQ